MTLVVIECAGQGWSAGSHGVWASGLNVASLGEEVKGPDGRLLPAINAPRELAWENEIPRSDHPGGVNALFCDGHVRFLADDIPADVLRCLASRTVQDNVFLRGMTF